MAYQTIDAATNQPIVPMNVMNTPTVNANLLANGTYFTETSTALAANGLYPGTVHDNGATSGFNRFRVVVSANAGFGHGHLILEQSTDNVTFRETHRLPVPSDGGYYTYDFAWNMRYIRVKFQNGAVLQTSLFIQAIGIREDGGMDYQQTPSFTHSTTALGISGVFTGVTLNTGSQNSYLMHKALVYTDQAGTLQMQQSRDGVTWRTTQTVAVPAATATVIADPLICQYCRVLYTNGATAQTVMELDSTLTHS
jgi:hypothetical protein